MLKVVHIQIFSEYTGRAALRLHRAFLNSGIDSGIITLRAAQNDDEKIKQKGRGSGAISRLNTQLESYLNKDNIKKFGAFSYPIIGSDISKMEEIKNSEIIYIHWALGGFLALSNFEQLIKLGKPVIFFMHDMWNITGGCHYSFNCEKYKNHCYDCQIFPGHKRIDRSFRGFEKKKKMYEKYDHLYFIAPSKWLYDCAKAAMLTVNKPLYHIPNLLDHSLFKPFNKRAAKEIFNINEDNRVIAFGALSLDNPYKGWSFLTSALKILSDDSDFTDITILIFGKANKEKVSVNIPFKTVFTGHLGDEYSTSLVYNAADVFLAPSLADNLPTTILESLSCGTPVVGFDVGGIPDMISHKNNGYLAKYQDATDLAEGIKFCLKSHTRGYTLPDFDNDLIIQKHLDLMKDIIP